MLEFFLEHAYLDHRGWNLIFYTGKKPLVSAKIEALTGTNVCVIKSRPNVHTIIRNIIYGIESGRGKPELYMPDQKSGAVEAMVEKLLEMDEQPGLTVGDKVDELSALASKMGYMFNDLATHLGKTLAADPGATTEFSESGGLRSSTTLPLLNPTPNLRDSVILDNFRKVPFSQSARFLDVEQGIPGAAVAEDDDGDEDLTVEDRRSQFKQSRSAVFYRSKMGSGRFRQRGLRGGDGCSFRRRTPQHSQRRLGEDELPVLSRGTGQRRLSAEAIAGGVTLAFQPWNDIAHADEYCKALSDDCKANWGIMYCGGANAIEKQLRRTAAEYELDFHSEAFAW